MLAGFHEKFIPVYLHSNQVRKPTGKRVETVFVVIVGIEGDKVSYEHIMWDQANVLVQIGLLDPTGLPVTGAGAAAKLRNPSIPDPFFKEG